jgi:hypothetical protein
MRFFFFLILISLFLVSCEEVVEVELQDASPEVVIEGNISSGNGPFFVRLTYSQPYFDQEKMTTIDDGIVTIKSGTSTETLVKKGLGFYKTSMTHGIPGRSYQLSVTTREGNYSASVTLPPPVPIDTIYYRVGVFNSDSLNIFVEFLDPPNVENYYRLKLFRNRKYSPDDYYMINDAFYDGQRIWAPFYYRDFSPGDTVLVELYNMERESWRYLKGLGETVQQNVNPQAPGNPPSNISGGALGFFGAWSVTTYETIVPGVQSAKQH